MAEYKGTYSQYLAQRAKDEVRLAKQAAAQAKEIDRLQTLVDRFGAKASKASMAHSLEKRIDRIKAGGVEGPAQRRPAAGPLPRAAPAGPHRARGRRPARRPTATTSCSTDLTFDVGRGERYLVMGFNGAGKTSLLRVIAGVTEADAGEVRTGLAVSIGYYAQEHEGIDPGRTLLDHVRASSPGLEETELRGLLGMFGLTGDKVFQAAGTLSGGEKTKLALSPARRRPAQRAAARRADQQPRPGLTRGDRPRRSPTGRARSSS